MSITHPNILQITPIRQGVLYTIAQTRFFCKLHNLWTLLLASHPEKLVWQNVLPKGLLNPLHFEISLLLPLLFQTYCNDHTISIEQQKHQSFTNSINSIVQCTDNYLLYYTAHCQGKHAVPQPTWTTGMPMSHMIKAMMAVTHTCLITIIRLTSTSPFY